MKPLITVRRAAETLVCSEKTIRRLILSGDLSALRVRNAIRITSESLAGYMRRQVLAFQEENGIVPPDED